MAKVNPIVETALKLQNLYPTAPPIDILDQAVKGFRGSSPDFESVDAVSGCKPHPGYDDETDPGSPFGELLRRAFAPEVDLRELLLLRSNEVFAPALAARRSAAADTWQCVIERFADRYQFWSE